MKYFRTGPQNVGSYGPGVKFEIIDGKRCLVFLDIEAETYPDDIVNVSYFYAVSNALKEAISDENLTGVYFLPAGISEGENHEIECDSLEDMTFHQLVVSGTPYREDFGILDNRYLVLSDRALAVVRKFRDDNLQNYDEGSSLELLPEL